MTHLLQNRSLLLLAVAESVSGIGNWITMLAIFAIVVFNGRGGVAASSGIFLAGLVPLLLASPAAGGLVDRFDRKRIMIASQLLAGLAIAGLVFTRQPVLVYTLVALQAVCLSVMTPARQAVVPDLVAREDLTRANALLVQLSGLIKIGAPVLAGLLLMVLSPHQAIILDVISFGLSAFILTRLPPLPPRSRLAGAGRPAHQPELTLPALLRLAPSLRLLLVLIFFGTMMIIGFDVMASIFTRDVLQGNEAFFGLLIGLVGLGAVGSSTFLLAAKGSSTPWRDVLAGMMLLACIPAAMALVGWLDGWPNLARLVAGIGCLLGGVGSGLLNIQAGTLLQLLSPPAWLGRMSGLFQGTVVAGQLTGLLLTPLLVPDFISMTAYSGLNTLALVLLVFYVTFQLRQSTPAVRPAGHYPQPAGMMQPDRNEVL